MSAYKDFCASMPRVSMNGDSPQNSKVKFSRYPSPNTSTASPEAFISLSRLQPVQLSVHHQRHEKSRQIPNHCVEINEIDKIEYDCFEQRIKNKEFDKTLALMDHLEYASTDALKVFYKYQTMCDNEAMDDMTKIVDEYLESIVILILKLIFLYIFKLLGIK